ncbi:MAG: Putidaredoxin reductase [Chromatiales bacterium USCg_Taylor]|nr:MAG: Putidaredoxin reductase [Chromatiales bacterium USCg_Taylor]
MAHYNYLIIGGGMTAASAIDGLRETDANGTIGVITAETHKPYDRPPLSKALWTGKKTLEEIMRPATHGNVTYHLGRVAQKLDLSGKQVHEDHGDTHTFDKLLLATGGTTRRLPFGRDDVIYFRTLADYQRLQELAKQHETFAVIGGGFIGSEVAAALAMNGKKVSLITPENGICARLFPAEAVAFFNDYYRQKGVEVITGESVVALEGTGVNLTLATKKNRRINANGVVAGIGIVPNVELAVAAGLKVDNGIVVDQSLRTSHPEVFAGGDVANYFDQALGARRRVEHEDLANTMGKAAGQAMAGANVNFTHTPFFYSDLFQIGYEAVGELDSRLQVIADWKEEFHTGVLYYLDNQRVRGVLLWNVWRKADEARALIATSETVAASALKGRIAFE